MVGDSGKASVGVVAAERETVLGPTGEHAVGLVDTAGHEVVDHHAQIGFFAAEHEWFLALQAEHRVRAGEQALPAGLFVAGGAVDLPGEVEPRYVLSFQR